MDSTSKAERFIERDSGCGSFQLIFLLVVVAPIFSTATYSIVFMAFGNYNPGWRCMDNVTSHNNSISTTDPYDVDYTIGSCDVYNQCNDVEFNPQSSTIVTEWGLLCDKSWMISTTISIQMAGMLIASFFVGQLTDIFGRKKTLYVCVASCGIFSLVSAFSVSWTMFVVTLFFTCGFSIASYLIVVIYVSEFVNMKWRAIIISFPFWYMGALVQAVVSLITKDWRQMQIIAFALHFATFIPVFWVPESLRWLEVKRMSENFNRVGQKIAKLNKNNNYPTFDGDDSNDPMNKPKITTHENVKKYTLVDVFRHGQTVMSICLGFLAFIFSVIFYSLTFGTKVLYGDFYINLIVVNAIAVPIFLLALLGIKYMSRKRLAFSLLFGSAVCIFVATGLLFTTSEAAKSVGSTVLIAIARATLDATWFCTYSRVTEIYPTVVRGMGVGYFSVTARVGGILAPFIIPEDSGQLYIFTIITGVLILISCILSCVLPETKGKPLKNDFESRSYDIPVEKLVDKRDPLI